MGNLAISNYSKKEAVNKDKCYSPPYVFDVLYFFIKDKFPPGAVTIWEPAAGDNYLAWAMMDKGYDVIATEKERGQDYFFIEPGSIWDIQITNPPYNALDVIEWVKRAYLLNKKFALLMRLQSLANKGTGRLFEEYGVEIIIPYGRFDFFMPGDPDTGKKQGYKERGYKDANSKLDTIWFTYGLDLPKQINWCDYDKPTEKQVVDHMDYLEEKYGKEPLGVIDLIPSPTYIDTYEGLYEQKSIFQAFNEV